MGKKMVETLLILSIYVIIIIVETLVSVEREIPEEREVPVEPKVPMFACFFLIRRCSNGQQGVQTVFWESKWFRKKFHRGEFFSPTRRECMSNCYVFPLPPPPPYSGNAIRSLRADKP
jgi:hypothetical protein